MYMLHSRKSLKQNWTGWDKTKTDLSGVKNVCMESLRRSQLKIYITTSMKFDNREKRV